MVGVPKTQRSVLFVGCVRYEHGKSQEIPIPPDAFKKKQRIKMHKVYTKTIERRTNVSSSLEKLPKQQWRFDEKLVLFIFTIHRLLSDLTVKNPDKDF